MYMRASLVWLNRLLDRPIEVEQAAEALTSAGFPVESWEAVEGLPDGRSDVRLDVEVTSNRGDVLCHAGVARELASATGRSFVDPQALPVEGLAGGQTDVEGLVRVEALEACRFYAGAVLEEVGAGSSCVEMVSDLEAVGLRSVNRLVDITNWVLMQWGQPLHAFDLDRLAGGGVVVRRSRKGEVFDALDGSKHVLPAGLLVIADHAKPQAVAGVMGGKDSEVTGSTRRVLLEAAVFDALTVRQASRALKISSDASDRYERGVSAVGTLYAAQHAAAMMLDAGGRFASAQIVTAASETAAATRQHPTTVRETLTLRTDRCRALLGLELDDAAQAELLGSLGLSASICGAGMLEVGIPSTRLDLTREVDLIEEVVRAYGLERVPVAEVVSSRVQAAQGSVASRRVVVDVMVGCGFMETITPSLMTAEHAQAASREARAGLFEPGGRAEATLRPSVLPSLLVCRKTNQDAGNQDVKLFELASCWPGGKERVVLAWLMDVPGRGDAALASAVRATRGVVEAVLARVGGDAAKATLGVDVLKTQAGDLLANGVAATVSLGDQAVGRYGLVSREAGKAFGLQRDVIVGELDLPSLLALWPGQQTSDALARFPAIDRDLSVVVRETTAWRDVHDTIVAAGGGHLQDVTFLELYRDQKIGAGRKSISLRMRFRDQDRTLTHQEVDPHVEAVVSALSSQWQGEVRAS